MSDPVLSPSGYSCTGIRGRRSPTGPRRGRHRSGPRTTRGGILYRCRHTTATTDWSRPAHVPPLGSVHLPLPPSDRRPRHPPRGRLRVPRHPGHRVAERRRLVRPEQRVGGGRRPSRGRLRGIGRLDRRGLPGRRRRGRALARVPGHDRDGARAARRRRPRRRHVRLRGDRRRPVHQHGRNRRVHGRPPVDHRRSGRRRDA